MKYLAWNEAKNTQLKLERSIGFEDIQAAFEGGHLLDNIPHPNQKLHPGQRIFVGLVNDYVFLVPFVEDDEKIFLKTIHASRKFTRVYLIERKKK